MIFHMLLRQDRATRCYLTNDRQPQIRLSLRQANTAAGARHHLDRTFASQRPEMLFRRIGRAETQLGSDFCASGRITGFIQISPDNIQHLGLSGGQLHAFSPGLFVLVFYTVI